MTIVFNYGRFTVVQHDLSYTAFLGSYNCGTFGSLEELEKNIKIMEEVQ